MYFLEKLNYINSFLQKSYMITDFVLSLNFLPLESELWMRKNITWICLKNCLKNRDKTPQFLEVCRRVAALRTCIGTGHSNAWHLLVCVSVAVLRFICFKHKRIRLLQCYGLRCWALVNLSARGVGYYLIFIL